MDDKPDDAPRHERNTRLFQIREDDLATLEADLPAFFDRNLLAFNDPAMRALFRRVQRIVVDVRWGYGPPQDVEVIPAGLEGGEPCD